MNICVRGPLLSISGYGNHTRQVYRWLSEKTNHKLTTQILPWGITPWHINPDSEGGLIGKIMSESTNIDGNERFDMSFQVQLPNEWDPNMAKFNVGVTAAVETDKCNPHWIQCCNQMNLVVVPSEHTKNVLESSGTLTTPIVVVAESFPDSFLQDEISDFPLPNVKTGFNFLMFGQITGGNAFSDRKNTFFTLKWLLEEFNGDHDVGVIIKTNNGRNTSIDRKMVRDTLRKVRSEINSDVPVYLLHGAMTDEEIAGLYKNQKIKALVTATRGEGYGLPLLEAAAAGTPVIATNWSGHLDFLRAPSKNRAGNTKLKSHFLKVDYDIMPVQDKHLMPNLITKECEWAYPKEKSFRKNLRFIRKNKDQFVPDAESLKEYLRNKYSSENIHNKYKEEISKNLPEKSKLQDEVEKMFSQLSV